MNNVDFTEYNRITDILMYLSNVLTLNFTVALSKKTKFGGRQFFQYEVEYGSDDNSNSSLRSIKRNMNFYFTIENREVFASGMMLRPQDIEIIIRLIEQKILPWFFGTNEYAFQIIENKLVLKEFEPVIYTQSDKKFIRFEPIVYSFDDGTFTPGILLTLGSGDSAPMNIDKFMGFFHLLKSDMYAIACNMVAYVRTPPYGVNKLEVGGLGTGKPRDNWNSIPDNYNGKGANSFLNNLDKKK